MRRRRRPVVPGLSSEERCLSYEDGLGIRCGARRADATTSLCRYHRRRQALLAALARNQAAHVRRILASRGIPIPEPAPATPSSSGPAPAPSPASITPGRYADPAWDLAVHTAWGDVDDDGGELDPLEAAP